MGINQIINKLKELKSKDKLSNYVCYLNSAIKELEYRVEKTPNDKYYSNDDNTKYYQCPTCSEWVNDEHDICCPYCGQLISY